MHSPSSSSPTSLEAPALVGRMASRLGVSGWKPCCCSFKLCPEWLGMNGHL